IDVAGQTGLFEPSLQLLTFGLVCVDYDGDGRKDIVTANGHIDENVALNGGGITFPEKLVAFHNTDGHFVPAGERLGPGFREARLWRGLAVGDFDNDGHPDLLVSACGGRPALLRNDGDGGAASWPRSGQRRGPGPGHNHWLQVKVIAAGRNREGIG